MATNENVNKVVFGGETLIDLTGDTVTADKLLSGVKAHDKSGAVITGACAYNADTSDATAGTAEILKGKTAYVTGSKVTGTMPNNQAVTGEISDLKTPYTIPTGFHDGSGKVDIAETEKEKIIPENIKDGIIILGVTGNFEGNADKVQAKEATPSTEEQVIKPDATYDYLSQVTVHAIPFEELDNEQGGKTVTIGGASI